MEGVKDVQGEPWHSSAVRTEGELALGGEADALHPGHSEGNPGWALEERAQDLCLVPGSSSSESGSSPCCS